MWTLVVPLALIAVIGTIAAIGRSIQLRPQRVEVRVETVLALAHKVREAERREAAMWWDDTTLTAWPEWGSFRARPYDWEIDA